MRYFRGFVVDVGVGAGGGALDATLGAGGSTRPLAEAGGGGCGGPGGVVLRKGGRTPGGVPDAVLSGAKDGAPSTSGATVGGGSADAVVVALPAPDGGSRIDSL